MLPASLEPALVAARTIAWMAVIASAGVLAMVVGLERIDALSIPRPVLVVGAAVIAIGGIVAATIWVKKAMPVVRPSRYCWFPSWGISTASWNGGVGNHRVVSVELNTGGHEYRVAIGQLTVDPAQAHLDAGDVTVTKIGELAVVVPSSAAVTLDTHVGARQSTIFGHDRSGLNVTDHLSDTPAVASGNLDLDVAVGQLTVCRVPPASQLPDHRRGPAVLARR